MTPTPPTSGGGEHERRRPDPSRITAVVLFAFAALGFAAVGAFYYGAFGGFVSAAVVVAAGVESLRRQQ